jgi:sugar O-acyltransferase (sialic acid O-acetyltransferase NeuD family)
MSFDFFGSHRCFLLKIPATRYSTTIGYKEDAKTSGDFVQGLSPIEQRPRCAHSACLSFRPKPTVKRFVKDILILGTGGNCVDILDAILAINESAPSPVYRIRGFLDDDKGIWGQAVEGYPVLGRLSQATQHAECYFVNGIGSARNYRRKADIIASTNLPSDRFETIIHPQASVSRFASVDRGTVVLQNATINSRAKVGCHVIILPNAVISHDVEIGDYCCLASGACIAGNCRVGKACYLGANCSVAGYLNLGDGSLIGMGAVVLKDVAEATVIVGNPARVLRSAG